VRQKYSDDLSKIFTSSLSAIGFVEDNGASCEPKSGGKFKYQHDTNKNLKYVHVFPHITHDLVCDEDGETGGYDEEEEPGRPEDEFLICDFKYFQHLVSEHLTTYGQKKRLLDVLKARITSLEAIELKMSKLEQLSAAEQAMFDGVGVDDLREKFRFISGELQQMIDQAQLTSAEKVAVTAQLEAKLSALEAELSKAETEGKMKRVQALTEQRKTLQKMLVSVKDVWAINLAPLKHGPEIQKLTRKLADLNRMEKASKGHYTIDELKRLGEKPELEEAISVLTNRSRGVFEDDEVFQERLDACLRAGSRTADKKASVSRPGSSNDGWAVQRKR